MKFWLPLFAVIGLFSGSVVKAEEHNLTTLRGDDIDLKVYDHAFAGSIRDFVVFGVNDEAAFSSELTMKRKGELVKAVFKKQPDGSIGGLIETHDETGAAIQTKVTLTDIEPDTHTITLKFNDQVVPVVITFDAFEKAHFINPTYTASLSGRQIQFKLENGKACYGFSSNLLMMILGAYLHP